MVFEVGKCYRHRGTGKKLKVLCEANTYYFGHCLIGETDDASFLPLGMTEEYTMNWEECYDWVQERLNQIPNDLKTREPDTLG